MALKNKLLILFVILCSVPVAAQDHKNTAQPYLENKTDPQTAQWHNLPWDSSDWAQSVDRPLDLIEGFYEADIFRNQYLDGKEPVLVVGPNFYHLSGYDKRRVVATLGHVYNVGAQGGPAFFRLTDWKTRQDIGFFNASGLQLQ